MRVCNGVFGWMDTLGEIWPSMDNCYLVYGRVGNGYRWQENILSDVGYRWQNEPPKNYWARLSMFSNLCRYTIDSGFVFTFVFLSFIFLALFGGIFHCVYYLGCVWMILRLKIWNWPKWEIATGTNAGLLEKDRARWDVTLYSSSLFFEVVLIYIMFRCTDAELIVVMVILENNDQKDWTKILQCIVSKCLMGFPAEGGLS